MTYRLCSFTQTFYKLSVSRGELISNSVNILTLVLIFLFFLLSDPRTENWWLMSGPGPLLTVLATYLYFCMSAGPRYMRDRKPYDLKNTIVVYNISQILMSIFLVYEVSCFEILTSERFLRQ